MSSSISLGTSIDIATLTSKSLTEVGSDDVTSRYKSRGDNFNICNKSHIAYCQDSRGIVNYRSRANLTRDNFYERRVDNFRVKSGDFYQEVDERMSRNSVEYPEQQAKYVGKWLNDMDFSGSMSFESNSHGNVIGIRGFPKSNSNKGSMHDQRAEFNKLKFNYSKLQSDYDKLFIQLGTTEEKFKQIIKKRDHDIDALKTFIRKHDKRSADLVTHRCCCENKSPQKSSSHHQVFLHDDKDAQELAKLRHERRLLELKLNSIDREHEIHMKTLQSENELFKNQTETNKLEMDKELTRLRNQVQALTLKPSNKLVISLRNENSRLKDSNELRMIEFQALKENYQRLESKLSAMLKEQQHLKDDKKEETSKLLVELCRLQVYQPKLEATLETERAIKSELQYKIESLIEENKNLKNQMTDQKLESNAELSRSRKIESSELQALQEEIAQWHEKYYRLKREKSDVEELLRSYKSKMVSVDSRQRAEMDLIKESSQSEINQLIDKNRNLEQNCNNLKSTIGTMETKLDECTMDKCRLTEEVMELNKRLANQSIDETITRKLKDNEERLVTLSKQLELAESKNRELLEECDTMKAQLSRSKQQIEQYRERFKIQQKTLDEMKEDRDKEVARLRVGLNFERYNRQVALKGIEKELRGSLKELETMKYRFTRRLALSDTIEKPNCPTSDVSSTSITTKVLP